MKTAFLSLSCFTLLFCGVLSRSEAALITTSAGISNPTVIDFSQFSGMGYNFTFGPTQIGGVVGENVIFTANPAGGGNSGQGSVLGSGGYGLGGNGSWGGAQTYSGLDSTSGSMTYTFADPVSAVGGFINYLPNGSVFIEALATDGVTVLESYDLSLLAPISTPGGNNDGAFRGISRMSADIGAFRVSNQFVVLDDLTFAAAIPEPTTMALWGLGAVGFAVVARRRRKMKAA